MVSGGRVKAMVERLGAWLANVLRPAKRALVPVPIRKQRTARIYAGRGR